MRKRLKFLKKSHGILRKEQQIKYAFIFKYRFKYAVKKLCRIIEVSRSGYYGWVADGCPVRQDKDAVVLAKIRKIERDNDHNYGVQRVYESLNKEHNVKCGRSKVQRIMHQNGIKAKIKSKYKPQTTKADPNEQAFPNLLGQVFGVTEFNQVWLVDITYIRTNGKWSYLAAVMDLGRRKIVGWALGTKPNAKLVCRALTLAKIRNDLL